MLGQCRPSNRTWNCFEYSCVHISVLCFLNNYRYIFLKKHVRAHQSAAYEVFGNKHVDILAKQGRNDSDSLGTTDPGYQLCKECVPGFLVAAAAAAAPSPASVSSGLVGAAGGAGAIVSDGECSGDEDGGGDAPPHIYPDEWAWLAAVEPPPVNARPTMKDLPTKTSDLYGQ